MAEKEEKRTWKLTFSPEQVKELKKISKQTGKSIKELLEEGMEIYLKEQIEQLGEEIKRVEVEE